MGASVRGEDDRVEPGADDASVHLVLGGRRGEAARLPAAPFRTAVYAGGHRPAGGGGRGPRDTERAGDVQASRAGPLQLRRRAIPAFGANLGGAVVPAAVESPLPRAAHQVSGDSADAGVHRRAEKTGAAGAARIPAHRHGASGRPGRGQGGVSHQRGGRSYAMGGGGGSGADQRSLSHTGAGG